MSHLFTSVGQVLLMIATYPDVRVREIADVLGVTERTVTQAIHELEEMGYLSVERVGRRNVYQVAEKAHCLVGDIKIGLSGLLAGIERRPA